MKTLQQLLKEEQANMKWTKEKVRKEQERVEQGVIRPTKFPMECCFCDNKITTVHQRHNADPIMDSWCCEDCNSSKVVPYRLRGMK